jgi:hypothetical protein
VTTEHFTLQGARTAAITESTSRASIFIGLVSAGLVALGLIATVTRIGTAFYAFGLILLSTLSIIGFVTLDRAPAGGRPAPPPLLPAPEGGTRVGGSAADVVQRFALRRVGEDSCPSTAGGQLVWPRPIHVGNEKYLGGFWIIAASGLDVALKVAVEGSKACQRQAGDGAPLLPIRTAVSSADPVDSVHRATCPGSCSADADPVIGQQTRRQVPVTEIACRARA